MARAKKLTPKKVEKPPVVEELVNKTTITVHNLSPLSPPTHTPTNKLTDSFTEATALDFVFGFGFPPEVHTTGKNTHNDFSKTFDSKK